MTAATKTAPTAKTAPAPKTTELWAWCSGCQRERRLTADGLLVQHRAWYGMQLGMRHCPGSGLAPAEEGGEVAP